MNKILCECTLILIVRVSRVVLEFADHADQTCKANRVSESRLQASNLGFEVAGFGAKISSGL